VNDDQSARHHIGSVVHHFLTGSIPTASSDGSSDIVSRARLPALHFAVASATAVHLSAFMTAQLSLASTDTTRGSGGSAAVPNVVVREWQGLAWSSLPWLTESPNSRPLSFFMAGPQPGRIGHACPGPGGGLALGGEENPSPASRPGLPWEMAWFHLGNGSENHLALLESAESWCRGAACPLGGRDGLVWCLRGEEATSWRVAYALGRLCGVVKPLHVVILMFAAGWDIENLGRGDCGDEANGELCSPLPEFSRDLVKACLTVNRVAVADGSVNVLPVPGLLADPGSGHSRNDYLLAAWDRFLEQVIDTLFAQQPTCQQTD